MNVLIIICAVAVIALAMAARAAWNNKKLRRRIRNIAREAAMDQNRLMGEINRKDMQIAKMRGLK
jgi:FtsZ-interacting cell division protein ZipA